MSREWKPGDVGLNESQGYRSIFIKRGDYGTCPAFHPDDPHWHTENGGYDHASFDYRPLVVIDPEDREQVERLIEAWFQRGALNPDYDRMSAALRSLVTPPKPDEPQGLGAVVEATAYTDKVRIFVRVDSDKAPWTDSEGNGHDWDELDLGRTLSDGVQP